MGSEEAGSGDGEREQSQGGYLVVVLFLILFALLSAWRIEDTPALSFDEGWVLTVARNWAESFGYTQFLLDKPVPAKMLNIGFPAIAPITLSFRILKTGIWQGRLPSVLLTTGSFLLLYFLSTRLFNRRVARMSLLALFLLSGVLHPVIWGKQAIGEVAAIFYLLAGFSVFLVGGLRSVSLVVISGVLMSLACITKEQFVPFVGAAVAAPLILAAFRRSWAQVPVLLCWLGSTAASFLVMLYVQRLLVGAGRLTEPGLYASTAFVTHPNVRIMALVGVLVQALPTVLGLSLACRSESFRSFSPQAVTRVSLLAFSMSWMAWYVFCSVAWARYMYPCLFAASPFVGHFLDSLIQRARSALKQRRFWPGLATASLAAGLVVWSGSVTTTALLRNFSIREDSLVHLAGFLNGLKDNPVIESFEMEVFFMLRSRNYHHPPDQVQLQLNRRSFLGEEVTVDYHPLAADPEYLVIGPAARGWGIYDQVLRETRFVPLGRAGKYDVYRRVRPVNPAR